jgi:hypothetical protein
MRAMSDVDHFVDLRARVRRDEARAAGRVGRELGSEDDDE